MCIKDTEDTDETNNINEEITPTPYSVGRVGNPENIDTETESGLVLMGGSRDVDEAMQWMINRAGGGDFVIIRASGSDGYNQYLYDMGNLNSVESFLLNSRESANDERIYEALKNADALFIAGGDQSRYTGYWENSKVEEALQYLIHEKGIPIGGTSAGCAIMGEFVYTGENGSVTSDEALSNPYNTNVTVRLSTLINHPMLGNTITDQHFSQRNREGRLVTFLARLTSESNSTPLRAIAVDERTAAVIDLDGNLTVLGDHNVYLLEETNAEVLPEELAEGIPLTWNNNQEALSVLRLNNENSSDIEFNLSDWNFTPSHYWFVDEGNLVIRNVD